jgi:hypothetical protein
MTSKEQAFLEALRAFIEPYNKDVPDQAEWICDIIGHLADFLEHEAWYKIETIGAVAWWATLAMEQTIRQVGEE